MRLQIIWPLPPPPTSFWSWPLAQCCRHTGPVFQAPLFPKSSVYPVLLLPLTQLTPSLFNTFSLKALSTVDDRYLFVCGRACIFCSARLCASALTTPQKAQPVCLFQLCTLHPAPALSQLIVTGTQRKAGITHIGLHALHLFKQSLRVYIRPYVPF